MLQLIPILLTWLGWYLFANELGARGMIRPDWRLFWLFACLGWGTWLTVLVEIGSLAGALSAGFMLVGWIASAAALLGLTIWLARRRGQLSWAIVRRISPPSLASWPLDARIMLLVSVTIIALLGLIALRIPNTNWDGNWYHLPRMMHWMQNQSVAPYPTELIQFQVSLSPWASYAIMALYYPLGNDILATTVQWFALVTCIIGAVFIAAQLLADDERALQVSPSTYARIIAFTSLLVTTLPIAITQATTAQNDLVTTAWTIAFIGLALALWREPSNRWYLTGAAAALALGILTKATMAIYVAPIGIAAAVHLMLRTRPRLLARSIVPGIVLLLLILGPYAVRTYQVYGSPLGAPEIARIVQNEMFTVSGTFSNIIRNVALQTPTDFAPLTRIQNGFLLLLHGLSGRSLNDPDITFLQTQFAFSEQVFINSDTATNGYHLLIVILTAVMFLIGQSPDMRRLGWYGGAVIVSFVLFCAYLRWQPWNTRLHLAYFVMLMPLAAIILLTYMPRVVIYATTVWFALAGFNTVFANESAPIQVDAAFMQLPREQQYFLQYPQYYGVTAQAVTDLVTSGCRNAGIKQTGNLGAEYPIWMLLRERGYEGRLDNVFVDWQKTASLGAQSSRAPCAVITGSGPTAPESAGILPYSIQYGEIAIYWAAEYSTWARLEQVTTDGAPPVVASGDALQFVDGQADGASITLSLRAPKSGTLIIEGRPIAADGAAIVEGKLKLLTDSGYSALQDVTTAPVTFAVPILHGVTTITLLLEEPTVTMASLADIQWTWQVMEEAMPPIAAVSVVQNPNGIEGPPENRFFWLGKGVTELLVRTSRSGTVELVMDAWLGPSIPGATSAHVRVTTSEGYSSEIQFVNGENRIALPLTGDRILVRLTPLDPPTAAAPNDNRPLIVNISNLRVNIVE